MAKNNVYTDLTVLEKEISDSLLSEFSERFQITIDKWFVGPPYINIVCQDLWQKPFMGLLYDTIYFTVCYDVNSDNPFIVAVRKKPCSFAGPGTYMAPEEVEELTAKDKDVALRNLCELIRNEIVTAEEFSKSAGKAVKEIYSTIRRKFTLKKK